MLDPPPFSGGLWTVHGGVHEFLPNYNFVVNELFTHFVSCFLNFHNVSASQLEVLVT